MRLAAPRALAAILAMVLPVAAKHRAKGLIRDMQARQDATQHGQKVAALVAQRLQQKPRNTRGDDAVPRVRFKDERPHTVVGSSSGPPGAEAKIAVLSVRPDGSREAMLSMLLAATPGKARQLAEGTVRFGDVSPTRQGTRISLLASGTRLPCVWVGHARGFKMNLIRLMCHSEEWHARRAMQSSRLDMSLNISAPKYQTQISFVAEAIDRLLTPARVSVCLDLQYFGFFEKRDFDEWAFAHQLLGVDRVYVPDQLAYRAQVATQLARGFAVPSHDLPHRYISPGGRLAAERSTYDMKVELDGVANYLCLHEHWYDDWIGVAWTPDEYLSFEGLHLPSSPRPGSVVADVLDSYAQLRRGHESNEWRFCVPELCMNRPFYAPTKVLSGESRKWTLPGDGMKVRFSANGQLAVERYTQRYSLLSMSSANRKCFVHSDWRLSSAVKLHGFSMDSCPERLAAPDGCRAAHFPALRRPCLDLCGVWGDMKCDECIAPPAPGCGPARREHMTADGEIMEGIELAHFRQPPKENARGTSREAHWLHNLSRSIRHLVEEANPGDEDSQALPNSSMAAAYVVEARRLFNAVAASGVARPILRTARQKARDRAVELHYLVASGGAKDLGSVMSTDDDDSRHPLPRSSEELWGSLQVLRYYLGRLGSEPSSG